MSSVIELAEVNRLQRTYDEHKRAEQFHKAEATAAGYALAGTTMDKQQPDGGAAS